MGVGIVIPETDVPLPVCKPRSPLCLPVVAGTVVGVGTVVAVGAGVVTVPRLRRPLCLPGTVVGGTGGVVLPGLGAII